MLSRTGRITSVAGLCLDGGGGNNKNNDKLRLRDCDGTEGQVWTVAGDGTVRVQGRCMLATTGLVRLRDCDGDAGQQWRLGIAGSLVNPASGLCLGSPGVARAVEPRSASRHATSPTRSGGRCRRGATLTAPSSLARQSRALAQSAMVLERRSEAGGQVGSIACAGSLGEDAGCRLCV
ncbi:ricin-type beta-trefoil lectin domain protein [Dactylosporangium cerinum]